VTEAAQPPVEPPKDPAKDPAPPVPRYGVATLGEVLPSVAAALGVPGEVNALAIEPIRRACVLLVDGMGLDLLRAHAHLAPFLASLLPGVRTLDAGFPSTTSTSLGSLGTGAAPGCHGLLGYTVAVPGAGRLLNSLRWDERVDPLDWQRQDTVFARAAAAGITVTQVAPASFEGTGLTVAALRGGAYAGAESAGERVETAAHALRAAERSLTYVYWGDLDATGHRRGVDSEAWRLELSGADRLAAALAEALPPDTALLVTADHGMVDIGPGGRVDVDADPRLAAGVSLLGGEPRARHVYAAPGAAADVAAAWQEVLGPRAWVATRDQAVGDGWFGRCVADRLRPRIGDVVAAAKDAYAFVAPRAEPQESALIGMHGSFTPVEQRIPLLEHRS